MELDPTAQALTKAIKQHESGGDYGIGLGGKKPGGSGEIGAYQFMPSTWKSYAKQVLGNENALPTPENQNKVAYTKVKAWKDAGYTPVQIASMWNAGEGKPDAWKGNAGTNSAGVKYDTQAYAKSVLNYYNQYKQQTGGAQMQSTQPGQLGYSNEGVPFTSEKDRALYSKAKENAAKFDNKLYSDADTTNPNITGIERGMNWLGQHVIEPAFGGLATGVMKGVNSFGVGVPTFINSLTGTETDNPIYDPHSATNTALLQGTQTHGVGEAVGSFVPDVVGILATEGASALASAATKAGGRALVKEAPQLAKIATSPSLFSKAVRLAPSVVGDTVQGSILAGAKNGDITTDDVLGNATMSGLFRVGGKLLKKADAIRAAKSGELTPDEALSMFGGEEGLAKAKADERVAFSDALSGQKWFRKLEQDTKIENAVRNQKGLPQKQDSLGFILDRGLHPEIETKGGVTQWNVEKPILTVKKTLNPIGEYLDKGINFASKQGAYVESNPVISDIVRAFKERGVSEDPVELIRKYLPENSKTITLSDLRAAQKKIYSDINPKWWAPESNFNDKAEAYTTAANIMRDYIERPLGLQDESLQNFKQKVLPLFGEYSDYKKAESFLHKIKAAPVSGLVSKSLGRLIGSFTGNAVSGFNPIGAFGGAKLGEEAANLANDIRFSRMKNPLLSPFQNLSTKLEQAKSYINKGSLDLDLENLAKTQTTPTVPLLPKRTPRLKDEVRIFRGSDMKTRSRPNQTQPIYVDPNGTAYPISKQELFDRQASNNSNRSSDKGNIKSRQLFTKRVLTASEKAKDQIKKAQQRAKVQNFINEPHQAQSTIKY